MKSRISEMSSKMAIIKSETPDLDDSSCELKSGSNLLYKTKFKKVKRDYVISMKDILIKVEEPLVDYDPPECHGTDPLVCTMGNADNEVSAEIDLDIVKSEYVSDFEIQQAFENKLEDSFGSFVKEELIEDIPQYSSIKNDFDNSISIKKENDCDDNPKHSNYKNFKVEDKSILAKSKAIQSLIEQKVFPNVNIVNGQMYFNSDFSNMKIKKEPNDNMETDILKEEIKIKKETSLENKNNDIKTDIEKPSVTEEYKCHICGYKCKYLTIYQNHITSHEVSDSMSLFSCSECDYRCSKKYNLTSHMKSHKKAFTCSECGKSFIFNKILTKDELLHKINKHMLIHKRKQCSGCEKMFSTNQALNKHIILQSTKKPVPCPECDKNFTLKCTFKIHMKTHIEHPFECTKCKKTFSQKGNLNRHLRKHSGEQLSRSPNEQEQLILQNPIYNNLLQLHLENSTSNPKINYNPTKEHKLYTCIKCENSFSTKFNLRRHLKLIHKAASSDD